MGRTQTCRGQPDYLPGGLTSKAVGGSPTSGRTSGDLDEPPTGLEARALKRSRKNWKICSSDLPARSSCSSRRASRRTSERFAFGQPARRRISVRRR